MKMKRKKEIKKLNTCRGKDRMSQTELAKVERIKSIVNNQLNTPENKANEGNNRVGINIGERIKGTDNKRSRIGKRKENKIDRE